ncbi:thermonuclease family protein [Lysinibacillus sp. NPDC097214]|uniref:thermonuclease family protein n=1 Tax=Lysinibacillus sp. NPDC097214 TaxID=3390584 RepID=UPI003D022526
MKKLFLYASIIANLSIFLILGGCEGISRLKKLVTDDQDLQIQLEAQEVPILEDWENILNYPEGIYSSTSQTASNDKILIDKVIAIDGDTLKARISKADLLEHDIPASLFKKGAGDYTEMTVRYLLIDTPESVHPTKGEQPYGKDASKRNTELLRQDRVSIMFDVGNKVDDYGRLLAYVYVGDLLIQESLVREGYARVGYVFPPNTSKLTVLQGAEKKAKAEGLLIWSIPNYVTSTGFKE